MDLKGKYVEIFLRNISEGNEGKTNNLYFAVNQNDLYKGKLFSLEKLPLFLAESGFLGLKIHMLQENGQLLPIGVFSILDFVEMSKSKQNMMDVLLSKSQQNN